jgi:DNA-binding Lrp family transcriptional regulator
MWLTVLCKVAPLGLLNAWLFSPKPANSPSQKPLILINKPSGERKSKLPSAIVLLSIASGTEKAVLKHLRTLEGISEAYIVQNAYDIIVKAKAETFEKLGQVISKIKAFSQNPLGNVTMLIVEGSAST